MWLGQIETTPVFYITGVLATDHTTEDRVATQAPILYAGFRFLPNPGNRNIIRLKYILNILGLSTLYYSTSY